MAIYTQLSYGSQGSDVTELQKLLNQNGYSLNEDGIYGTKTQSAVRDYQQKNSLAVDGIVGTNTWNALTKVSSTPVATKTTASTSTGAMLGAARGSYGSYQESDAVKKAQALLQQQLANKPGEYQSQWQDQINAILDKIMNREKFSYDLNGDALYQQYKDQYALQGQKAMMDTMGQAAALTGGYGNSYAQTAGQQAYQGYLQQANDKIPELYQIALDQYNREGDAMYDEYALLGAQEEQDYGRYRDTVSDYNAELDRLTSQYNAERDYDYNKWLEDRDFQYQQDRDAIEDQQWNQSFQYQKDRDALADQQWQKEFDEAVRQYNQTYSLNASKASGSSGSSGGSSSSGGGGYNNQGYSDSVVKQAQAYVGATQDGKWGANSSAAAAKKGYDSLAAVVSAMKSRKTPTGNNGGTPVGTAGFTGSTYNEAVSYLKSKGKSTAGLMTSSEWTRHKNNNNSNGGEHMASSYKEYLAAYVYGA